MALLILSYAGSGGFLKDVMLGGCVARKRKLPWLHKVVFLYPIVAIYGTSFIHGTAHSPSNSQITRGTSLKFVLDLENLLCDGLAWTHRHDRGGFVHRSLIHEL